MYQDRQCTYDVTRMCVRVTLWMWKAENIKCVCSLKYPACTAHAPYYIVTCGPSVSTIFSHITS